MRNLLIINNCKNLQSFEIFNIFNFCNNFYFLKSLYMLALNKNLVAFSVFVFQIKLNLITIKDQTPSRILVLKNLIKDDEVTT